MAALTNTNTTPNSATIGYGSTFGVATLASPTTFVVVAELKEIKPSGVEVGEEDVTTLTSPGGIREYIPTLASNGTIELSGDYIGDTTQKNLESMALARTVFPFQILGAVAGETMTRTGTGFLTKFSWGDLVVDKVPTFTATLRVTGMETTTIA